MERYVTNDEIRVLIDDNLDNIRSLAGKVASGFLEYEGTVEKVEEINHCLRRITELKAMQQWGANGNES